VIFDVYTAGFPNVWDANLNYILMAYIITPTAIGERSIVMSVSVCVCLSAIISSELHVQFPPKFFLRMLHMAVARSSSDGVVICYVLPVLWMTS